MPTDYIPGGDAGFNTWANSFMAYASANSVALGLEAGDLAPLTTHQSAWNSTLAAHMTAKGSARAACEAKDAARKQFEAALRKLVRKLQASDAVDDSEREALGVTVADTVRSAATTKATRPRVVIDPERLRHTVHFYEESTPSRRAKPDGVLGCEIWVKIGDPAPTDGSQCQFLALDSATPYVADYPGTDAGKTAHYMLRWVTRAGKKGVWGETVSETIRA